MCVCIFRAKLSFSQYILSLYRVGISIREREKSDRGCRYAWCQLKCPSFDLQSEEK